MRKYILEEYVFNEYNASSKAREDVSKFVLQNGFLSIARNDKRKFRNSKLLKGLLALTIYGKLFFRLHKNDILFLQTSSKILDGILKIKKCKNFKIIYLIHDVFSIRYDDIEEHRTEIMPEIQRFNQCNYIICHNTQMINRLKELGCKTQMIPLHIFDYSAEDFIPQDRKLTIPCINFAGNLGKSPFLKKLDMYINPTALQFHIYGLPQANYNNLSYCGSFPAEQLPRLMDGHFGLVWEGDYEIQEKDNYLRYNNPHKASLYIVSGLPIIVWSKAAIANLVQSHKVGICIDSLDEIEEKVSSIKPEDYNAMHNNCLKLRSKLISGSHLKNAINQILAMESSV